MNCDWQPHKRGPSHTQLCVWKGASFADAGQAERIVRGELQLNNPIVVVGNVRLSHGRVDFLFLVHDSDLRDVQGLVPRRRLGIEWWEDSLDAGDDDDGYPEEVTLAYPPARHATIAAGRWLVTAVRFGVPKPASARRKFQRRLTSYTKVVGSPGFCPTVASAPTFSWSDDDQA